jgi:fructose-bisphosphate aldolase class I
MTTTSMSTEVTVDETARALVADGKGLLAADETPPTLTRRLAALTIASTPDTRRDYREMLFSTPGIADFISGVIMQDETIHQDSAAGEPLVELVARRGMIPGIKVDHGVTPLAGSPGEFVTEGLDGLRDRLATYRELGARFAKWRAVFFIDDGLPTATCVDANAHALARYAALCQEEGLVPIVEPEVLMDGAHTIERCEDVTEWVLQSVFDALFHQRVALEGMLLKPNMVVPGGDCPRAASIDEVAAATVRTLNRHVPPAVPGVVFLSGGQDCLSATENLCAINQMEGPKPWKLSFSYGRALQDEALQAWRGRSDSLVAGQQAFHHRAHCGSAACMGRYGSTMETDPAFA